MISIALKSVSKKVDAELHDRFLSQVEQWHMKVVACELKLFLTDEAAAWSP